MEKNGGQARPNCSANGKLDTSKESVSNTGGRYKFYRKPSFRKTAPLVRQTKTSLKRMLLADPLLKLSENEFGPPQLSSTKNLEIKQGVKPAAHSQSNNVARAKTAMQPHFQSENVLNTKRATHSQSLENLSNAKLAPHPKFSENKQSAKRRSRSAENMSRQSKSTAHSKSSEKVSRESRPGAQSKSTENMSCSKWSAHSHSSEKKSVNKHASEISPILEVSREENLVFRTPSAYQRRSIAKFTPNTSARRSLFVQSKVFPTLEELQHRLNGWLLKHGKNPTTFSHLQELVGQKVGDEDKENVVEGPKNAGSYEDLHILPEEAKPKLQISGEETDRLAREALQDLFKLIQEEYPASHCESWLGQIVEKCEKLKDEPQYWECRAKIEQMRGNVGDAIEHYKTAIIQGAEVSEVDQSLDSLLQKFSLLNIENDLHDRSKLSKRKTKVMRELHDAFKSSVIKFAVQEKKLKNQKSKILVTPVRRSSRLSPSVYTSTPGVKLYNSINDMEPSEKKNMSFVKNKAL